MALSFLSFVMIWTQRIRGQRIAKPSKWCDLTNIKLLLRAQIRNLLSISIERSFVIIIILTLHNNRKIVWPTAISDEVNKNKEKMHCNDLCKFMQNILCKIIISWRKWDLHSSSSQLAHPLRKSFWFPCYITHINRGLDRHKDQYRFNSSWRNI